MTMLVQTKLCQMSSTFSLLCSWIKTIHLFCESTKLHLLIARRRPMTQNLSNICMVWIRVGMNFWKSSKRSLPPPPLFSANHIAIFSLQVRCLEGLYSSSWPQAFLCKHVGSKHFWTTSPSWEPLLRSVIKLCKHSRFSISCSKSPVWSSQNLQHKFRLRRGF